MNKLTVFAMSMAAGGAEKVISLLLKQLIQDYDVTLFLFYDSSHYSIPNEVKVISLYKDGENGLLRRLLSIPKGIINYARFLQRTKQDVSMSFLYRPNIVSGILTPFFKHTKFIISERNYPSIEYAREGIRGSIGRLILRLTYNRANILFSNSEYINLDLKENFRLSLPMKVIYNPIEIPEEYHAASPTDCSRIVTVGRFVSVKNHNLLFNALAFLPNHTLTIWGDGDLREKYEKTIMTLDISSQVLLPGKTNSVLERIKGDHIFVLSSNSEGFPNVLLEAMSVGLPVISTNCLSGPLELLNDNERVEIAQGCFVEAKYGILINVDDKEGLVKAISYLSDHYEKRRLFAERARARSQEYSLPNIYNQLKALIERDK